MLSRHRQPAARPRAIALLALMVVLGSPSVAGANAGTPLMWAGTLHLLFGNAFIGVLEGALLAHVYRVSVARAMVLMVLANYFSAWVGWVWLAGLLGNRDDIDLYNASRVLWSMVAAAYAVTLVLEWPFVAGCFGRSEHFLRRSCGATLLVQSVSYVILFGWFGAASVSSLFSEMTIVPAGQISLPAEVRIYYIADEDGNMYSQQLSTGHIEKVFDLNSTDIDDCLSFRASQSEQGMQEIVALFESGSWGEPKIVGTPVVVAEENCPHAERDQLPMLPRFHGPGSRVAPRLGTATESPWTFRTGYWPAYGLFGENSQTGAHLRFALETPFLQWAVRHAILLPSDRVLFQLGKRQICILDPETKRVAVLCYGRGAVAVLEPPAQQP